MAGIFPEGTRGDGELRRFHHGAAYLALVTGAPVVPVTMLGTRPPGGGGNALPARGDTVDLVFGQPWRTTQQPWPRTREHVAATSVLLREHLLSELATALARHAPILARAASCGTIRGRPRHRARRAIQRAVITHD